MNTPYYPQLEERDCGATCLRMVLAHHGLAVPMERLRVLSATDERGTDLAGLARAAEALGFETVAADLSYDDLLAPDLWPAILHWDGDHFVVVTEVNTDRVELLDPALGQRRLDRETFESYRLGAGHSRAGLLLVPTRPAQRQPGAKAIPGVMKSNTPLPIAVWATSLLYAGFAAAGLYALLRVLRLAVDLQFHEAWLSHLGVLLLVLAAVILGRYLVRRTVIQYADAAGQLDTLALATRIGRDAATPRRAGDTALAMRLIEDVDAMRVWRAYRLGNVFISSAAIVVSLAFGFGVDAVWGLALFAVAIGVGLTYFFVAAAAAEVAQHAQSTQLAQREGFVEYARLLPEVVRGGRPGEWLQARLELRNRSAAGAFDRLTAEVIARADLKLMLACVCAVLLVSLGLYRLGYAGLQVADFLFLLLLTWVVLNQLPVLASAYRSFGRTTDARLRLEELREPIADRASVRVEGSDRLRLEWRGPLGNYQSFDFGLSSHLALVGTDVGLRRTLIDTCLGRESATVATLSTGIGEYGEVDVFKLGRAVWLSAGSPLLNGTLAENIVLDEVADQDRLAAIVRRLDLNNDELPQGLDTRVDERGSQLSAETFVKTIVARALYTDAEILVLDGLTDGLPVYQEALIFDELLSAATGRLVICNARRLSATYGFDVIVQLEAGELEAVGSHDALAAAGGAYAIQLATERGIER